MVLPVAPDSNPIGGIGTSGDIGSTDSSAFIDSQLRAALLDACPHLPAGALWVAYSGGLDSTVLLHLTATLRKQGALQQPVQAIHINHGLQATADHWQLHCQQVCLSLDVPFFSERVHVDLASGDSPEEAARRARHAVFESILHETDILLLAQHLDDQVETVLFRLLRGSGVTGLAGMPRSRACGHGVLLRPFLDQRRAMLLAYAQQHGLQWVEDGSNQDQRYDRNFLRGAIVPVLEQRWPGLATTLIRSARLCGEAASLLDEQAAQDLAHAIGPSGNRLRIAPLQALREERQRNLLRYWLRGLHEASGCAVPTHQVLQSIVDDILPAVPDAEPLLTWGRGEAAVELRRFQGQLYVLRPLPELPGSLHWDTHESLQLPAPLGSLTLQPCAGPGLPLTGLQHVEVRFRRGGEFIKAAGRPTRALKKILQEQGVPPWLRNRIPLLYVEGALVAVGDLLVSESWLDKSGENCGHVVWQKSDLDCGG